MILSLVIPMYKVERYIEKCLLSCVKQDIPSSDYEIIVINDGSPDNSMALAAKVAQQYDNIIIISQDNKGLSAARNEGIHNARGKYIWFIDSDDYIEHNCLGRITSKLVDDIDLLQIQYRDVFEDGSVDQNPKLFTFDGILDGKELTLSGGLPQPAQFTIVRTEFLRSNQLCFVDGIYHEDAEFKPRATYLAKKIATDSEVSYNYLRRTSGSITSSFKLKNGLDLFVVVNNLLNFTKRYNLSTTFSKAFYQKIGCGINSILWGYQHLSPDERKIIEQYLHNNRHLFRCMRCSGDIKYIIEGICFGLSIELGLRIHRLVRGQ